MEMAVFFLTLICQKTNHDFVIYAKNKPEK